MKTPGKPDVIPIKCARCGSERIRREELAMHGKWGFMGRSYKFDFYICQQCGYSELFFKRASWLA